MSGPPVAASTANPASANVVEKVLALFILSAGAAASGLLCAVWLNFWAGGVPLPLTIVAAAGINSLLVRAASRWTFGSNGSLSQFLVLAVWLTTIAAINVGPGGDTPTPIGLRLLLLLVAGIVIPLWWTQLRSAKSPPTGSSPAKS